MTHLPEFGSSYAQVAGAVAEAVNHDLRGNFLSLSGFLQIDVSDAPGDSFTVEPSWKNAPAVRFQLSKAEASAAVKKSESRKEYDQAFLDKVQRPLADLEGKASRSPAMS